MRKILVTLGLTINLAFAATNYVSLTGSSTPPYDTWAKAATNIQFAIDAASDGDIVLVQTGKFVGVAEEVSGSMVSITKAITLESVSGAIETTIDAAGWHRRAIYINNPNAVVRGFLIELGYARTNFGPQFYPVSCGGGVFFDGAGTVEECILKYNRAGLAGGSAFMNGGGLLRNCLIYQGEAAECGGVYCTNGGEIVNCTIVDNWTLSTNYGGGVWNINGGDVINSIVYANSNTVGNEVDVHTEGSGWSYKYSLVPATISGEGNISGDPLFENVVREKYSLNANSPCRNAGTNLAWMTDSTDLSGGPRISEGRVDIGAYELFFKYFVSLNGLHKRPFASWKNAATNIQDAIDAAIPLAEVIVSNGTYYPNEEIQINTNVIVKSLNGQTTTIIDGLNSKPCVLLGDNSEGVLSGFTITGGAETNGSGGAIALNSGLVTNCIIKDSYSSESGGGVVIKGGTLIDSKVYNCTAEQLGGGINIDGGAIINCVIQHNEGHWGGGGIGLFAGEIRNCLIISNSTIASPIPLAGNMQTGGGGIFSLPSNSKIINCTIADNVSSYDGGGVYDIDFFGSGATTFYENVVLYSNSALSNGNNYVGGSLRFLYCCTTPDVPATQDGGGNVYTDPLLAEDYKLTLSSPCKDAGTNMTWMIGATDLAGEPRIYGGTVDMGAYEFVPEPTFVFLSIGILILFLGKIKLKLSRE